MQLTEAKKRVDDLQQEIEEMQTAKRKVDKEMEALQDRIDELTSENNKVVKSKKKVQEEVSVERERPSLHMPFSSPPTAG